MPEVKACLYWIQTRQVRRVEERYWDRSYSEVFIWRIFVQFTGMNIFRHLLSSTHANDNKWLNLLDVFVKQQLFKGLISATKTYWVIQRIVIYPMDGAIQWMNRYQSVKYYQTYWVSKARRILFRMFLAISFFYPNWPFCKVYSFCKIADLQSPLISGIFGDFMSGFLHRTTLMCS